MSFCHSNGVRTFVKRWHDLKKQSMANQSRATRSSGPLLDANVVFPPLKCFEHPNKLPTVKSVIGCLKYLTEAKNSHESAVKEVAKRVYCKYYHDTVCCSNIRGIERRITKLWSNFREGRKRIASGRKGGSAVEAYKKIITEADKLFDVSVVEDATKRKECEREWGVNMAKKDFDYYENMKTGDRKWECDHGVDPVWYCAMLRKQRMRERHEEYKRKMNENFEMKNLDEITEMLNDEKFEGEEPEEEEEEEEEEEMEGEEGTKRGHEGGNANESSPPKKKRSFVKVDKDNDSLPPQFQHLRESERKVKDAVYYTIANLTGLGMSIPEATKAIVEVGNGLFGRSWKLQSDDTEVFDNNTMPSKGNIRDKLTLIETQSLSLIADEIVNRSNEGRMITHAIDSTTKKNVGTFATQGIHIGQESPLPLPLIGIVGESTDDVALQIDFAFEVLAVTKGTEAKELYKMVDVHMTDSTEHNKGIADVLAEIYDLESPAGQLFCGSHTTLGFAREMNQVVSMIEKDMSLDAILAHFMVDMAPDTKHDSIAGQALDMALKLVAPEFDNKMWNKHKLFINYLKDHDMENVLFCYKDKRFGCLSRAAAVLLFYWESLSDFLDINSQITNRLSCLVRDLMSLPHLKIVFAVFAALGVHLVEPFYWKTIEKGATHSKLKVFYKELYASMENPVTIDFFQFTDPAFEGVSNEMFQKVKDSYKIDVLAAVTAVAEEHTEEVLKLVNLIIPNLRTVLARQRRDYGISEDFPAQFPVDEQAPVIDDTPVHNLGMERQCGTVDHRLKKLQTLAAVARSMIIQRTKHLRGDTDATFRSFKAETQKRQLLELEWSAKMKLKFADGANENQIKAEISKRKQLNLLDELKKVGGPFTDADEVRSYVSSSAIEEPAKKKRMKAEVKFARESTTTLPKADTLFRIQVTLPNKKRRDKTSEEFGEALAAYLGKKSDVITLELSTFKTSLCKICSSS